MQRTQTDISNDQIQNTSLELVKSPTAADIRKLDLSQQEIAIKIDGSDGVRRSKDRGLSIVKKNDDSAGQYVQ